MLPLEARKYLFDIQQACERLIAFTSSKALDDYLSDALLRSAVERQFEIIGEALRQMLDREPGLAASISEHKRIIAFRNRLIHGYASIADEVVWGILETNLAKLHDEARALLTDMDPS